jgi:hypothetical protein
MKKNLFINQLVRVLYGEHETVTTIMDIHPSGIIVKLDNKPVMVLPSQVFPVVVKSST